jgi:tripeptidyl-peptidase-1
MHISLARRVLLALLVAAEAAMGSPLHLRSPYALKETHNVPRKWSRVGPAPSDHTIHLQIGLKQSQFDELERHLYEGKNGCAASTALPLADCSIVSDPAHSRYGQHLTEAEVNELVKPSDDALELVHEWLFDHGIEATSLHYSPAKDWIRLSLPVSDVESLLETEYSVFEHEEGGQIVRAPEWSLPKHLHEHIDVIQPTTSFFAPRAMRSTLKTVAPEGWKPPKPISHPTNPTVAQVCNETAVTPLCLRTLYGTYDYTPKAAGKNKVGLNDFLGESNNRSDAYIFLNEYRPEAAAAAYEFSVEVIADGNNEQTQENATELANGKDLEGNLDAETILGISWPTPLTAFTTGGSPPFNPDAVTPTDTNEPYLTWIQYVLAQSDLPQVISTSYDDDEQTVPLSYATSVCNGFAQLGARGISLLFASGDSGVGAEGYVHFNLGRIASVHPEGTGQVSSHQVK